MQKLIHASNDVEACVTELSGGDATKQEFYADIVSLQQEFVQAPFEMFPRIEERPVDLYALFKAVCDAGGFRALEKHSEADKARALGVSEALTPQAISIYEEFLLLYERACSIEKLTQEDVEEAVIAANNAAVSAVGSLSHLDSQVSTCFSYKSMHIPARRVEEPPEEFANVRAFHYNNIPFGCAPVMRSQEFGIESITGPLDTRMQEQFVATIEKEKSLVALCNYMLLYPEQFMRTPRIQYLLGCCVDRSITIDEFVHVADSLSHVADMFVIDSNGVLFRDFALSDVLDAFSNRLEKSELVIEIMIRFLAKLSYGNNESEVVCAILLKHKESLIKFLLFFARGEQRTKETFYTFTAALYLSRSLIARGVDEMVFVALEVAGLLVNASGNIERMAFANVFELLLELCASEQYDSVLVFLFENAQALTEQQRVRLPFPVE